MTELPHRCAFIAVALIAAVLTQNISAVVNVWDCANALCSDGSCRYTGNVTSDHCGSYPDGYNGHGNLMVKLSCMLHPDPAALCVEVGNFGSAAQTRACHYRVAAIESAPCNVCLQDGPNGAPMMYTGCSSYPFQATLNYNCNNNCSSCESVAVVNSTCQEAAGSMMIFRGVTQCPKLVAIQHYSGTSATGCQASNLAYTKLVPEGLTTCNSCQIPEYQFAHPYARIFTCL